MTTTTTNNHDDDDDSGINASSKLGGQSAKGVGVSGGVFPSPPHWEHFSPPERSLGVAKFFVVISKWHILVNSEVLSYFFFIVSSLSGVWVDSVANFGFSSKAMNKRHH